MADGCMDGCVDLQAGWIHGDTQADVYGWLNGTIGWQIKING